MSNSRDKRRWREVEAYAEHHLDHPLEFAEPRHFSPMETIEILWPLNDVFRPNVHRIRTEKYRATYERKADDAIREFVYRPDTWDRLPTATWRVLLERHLQMLTVLAANHASGVQSLMSLPRGLPESARLGFAMLFWLYRMKLPWPVDDRAAVELPEGAVEAFLRPH